MPRSMYEHSSLYTLKEKMSFYSVDACAAPFIQIFENSNSLKQTDLILSTISIHSTAIFVHGPQSPRKLVRTNDGRLGERDF